MIKDILNDDGEKIGIEIGFEVWPNDNTNFMRRNFLAELTKHNPTRRGKVPFDFELLKPTRIERQDLGTIEGYFNHWYVFEIRKEDLKGKVLFWNKPSRVYFDENLRMIDKTEAINLMAA